jgi:hypothetical protein
VNVRVISRQRACWCTLFALSWLGASSCGGKSAAGESSTPGPGEAWLRLELESASGPCPPSDPCATQRSLTPDGHLTVVKGGVTSSAVLTDIEMTDINRVVNGANFRGDMRDGFACALPINDLSVALRLTLPSGTLTRDVTTCVVGGPDGNDAQMLAQMLMKY